MMDKVIYQRDAARAQLIMEAPAGYGDHYQFPMMIFNDLAGCLPVGECFEGDKRRYYYDVTGSCSLDQLMLRGQFDAELIRDLVADLIRALESARAYLLDCGRLSLRAEYIYYKDEHFHFCYIPFKEPDFELEFGQFAAFVTEHVDERDTGAITLAGRLYSLVLEGPVDILALKEILKDGESETESFEVRETQTEVEEFAGASVSGEKPAQTAGEEFPLWRELFEDDDRGIRAKKKKKKADRNPWGDWSAFSGEIS